MTRFDVEDQAVKDLRAVLDFFGRLGADVLGGRERCDETQREGDREPEVTATWAHSGW